MKKQAGIILIYIVGWLLILFGVASLFLPLLPGLILIILGVYLISLKSIWVKGKLDRFLEKHPHLNNFNERIKKFWPSLYVRIKNFFKVGESGDERET